MTELWFLVFMSINGVTLIPEPNEGACYHEVKKLAESPMGIKSTCISSSGAPITPLIEPLK